MNYPNQLTALNNGISLYVPNKELVKQTYEQLLKDDANTPFPFWAKIWTSSIALCDFLKAHPSWVQGKNVLEIGAGIGLPSFSVANMALNVLISDHAKEAIDLMQKNISYLQFMNVTAACLDWNHFPTNIKADTILLSDINYAPDEFAPLLILLNQFLNDGSTLIIATPPRMMGAPFIQQLKEFIQQEYNQNIVEENQSTEVSIYLLSK
jgi:predicted nicotinamide N-methyase